MENTSFFNQPFLSGRRVPTLDAIQHQPSFPMLGRSTVDFLFGIGRSVGFGQESDLYHIWNLRFLYPIEVFNVLAFIIPQWAHEIEQVDPIVHKRILDAVGATHNALIPAAIAQRLERELKYTIGLQCGVLSVTAPYLDAMEFGYALFGNRAVEDHSETYAPIIVTQQGRSPLDIDVIEQLAKENELSLLEQFLKVFTATKWGPYELLTLAYEMGITTADKPIMFERPDSLCDAFRTKLAMNDQGIVRALIRGALERYKKDLRFTGGLYQPQQY